MRSIISDLDTVFSVTFALVTVVPPLSLVLDSKCFAKIKKYGVIWRTAVL